MQTYFSCESKHNYNTAFVTTGYSAINNNQFHNALVIKIALCFPFAYAICITIKVNRGMQAVFFLSVVNIERCYINYYYIGNGNNNNDI